MMEPHNINVNLNLVKVETDSEQIENVEMQCEPILDAESQNGFFEDSIEIKEDPLNTECIENDEESVRALIGGEENGQALIGCGGLENVSLQLPTEHVKLESASQAAWCNVDEMEALSRLPAWQRESLICQPASQDSRDPLSLIGGEDQALIGCEDLKLEDFSQQQTHCQQFVAPSSLLITKVKPCSVLLDCGVVSSYLSQQQNLEISSQAAIGGERRPVRRHALIGGKVWRQALISGKARSQAVIGCKRSQVAPCQDASPGCQEDHRQDPCDGSESGGEDGRLQRSVPRRDYLSMVTTVGRSQDKALSTLPTAVCNQELPSRSIVDEQLLVDRIIAKYNLPKRACPLCERLITRTSVRRHIVELHFEHYKTKKQGRNWRNINEANKIIRDAQKSLREEKKAMKKLTSKYYVIGREGWRRSVRRQALIGEKARSLAVIGCEGSQAALCQDASPGCQEGHRQDPCDDDASSTLDAAIKTKCNKVARPSTRNIVDEDLLADKIMAKYKPKKQLCPLCEVTLLGHCGKQGVRRHIIKIHFGDFKNKKCGPKRNKANKMIKEEIKEIWPEESEEPKPLMNPTCIYNVIETISKEDGKPDQYKCRICPKIFVKIDNIKKHISAKHFVGKKFKCNKCFASLCPLCTAKFASDEERKKHIWTTHLKEKPFHCPKCERNLTDRTCFITHIENTHKIVLTNMTKMYEILNEIVASDNGKNLCPFCDHQKVPSLRIHVHKEHLNFKCKNCFKIFVNKQNISKYENFKESTEENKSLECDEESPSYCNLCKKKTFECDNCERRFIFKSALRKHYYDIHIKGSFLANEGKYLAAGKIITENSHLERGTCPLCKKIFSKKANLKIHIVKQHLTSTAHLAAEKKLNVKPVKCKNCCRTLKNKSVLRLHLTNCRFSKSQKNYECINCTRLFSTKNSLRSHNLKYCSFTTPQKCFRCKSCGKLFCDRPSLNAHLPKCPEISRFDLSVRCTACHAVFTTKDGLTRHFRGQRCPILKSQGYKCEHCKKIFPQKRVLQKHMLETHARRLQAKIVRPYKKVRKSRKKASSSMKNKNIPASTC